MASDKVEASRVLALLFVGMSLGVACSNPRKEAPSEGSGALGQETRDSAESSRASPSPLSSSSSASPPPITSRSALKAELKVQARQQIDAALSRKGLPGAEGLSKVRGPLLARAKNEPVFFVRTPEYAPASDEIEHYRFRVRSSASPWSTLGELLAYFIHYPEKGRLTLLREGYLYSEDPKVAYALVGLVGAHHLFDSERIWVQRGEALLHGRREKHRYVFEDGAQEGEAVRLLLLDRVGSGDSPQGPALHRDFRALRYQLGFDRVVAQNISEDELVVKLRYGPGLWITTLLGSVGPKLRLVAELVDEDDEKLLEQTRTELQERLRFLRVLQEAILVQVEEAPPFDEPRTEIGQQDGILRRAWSFAYERGRATYHVYDDWYQVFDRQGRPRVPQVCIDFLLDTFERASGTWWHPRGKQPGRFPGSVDFEKFESRNNLRRSRRFVEFTLEHPEWWDVHAIPEAERIDLGNKRSFFSYLAKHADDYATGDMVFIRGKTPWDPHLEHTHSFFIFETDPITGIPIAIAGNALFPALWSWESEARRTPLRTLRYRIRPTQELLRRVAMGSEMGSAIKPPPLAP